MFNRRLKEIIGLAMIGEGLLAVLDPAGHVGLWHDGPKTWRKMMDPFARHPQLTRAAGAAELALGLWLATRQFHAPASPARSDSPRAMPRAPNSEESHA